jgi:ElaB/YqjD/DUF883 family membrane-anchored ribosome-binding protein
MTRTVNITQKDTRAAANAVQDYAEQAGKKAATIINTADQTLRETAERLGRETRDAVDNVVGQVKDVSGQVRGRVEAQPMQSALIALGAGFLLGFLFRK